MRFPGALDEWVEQHYTPEKGTYNAVLVRGRFNPPGNHHLAMIDAVADEYDVETMYLAVEDGVTTDGDRTAQNPLRVDEVTAALGEGLAGTGPDYDVAISTHGMDSREGLMWETMDDILTEQPLYCTGDAEQAISADIRRAYLRARSDGEIDFDIRYRPRHKDDFGEKTTESGTELKTMMQEGNQRWRDYVPDSTEAIIDTEPEITNAMARGSPDAPGKHLGLML